MRYFICMLLVFLCQYSVAQKIGYIDSLINKYDHEKGHIVIPVVNENPPYNIFVNNQVDFDNLGDYIINAISIGAKNIIVWISSGTFYYKDEAIKLYNFNVPDVSISIHGNNSILTGDGNNYKSIKCLIRKGSTSCDYENELNFESTFVTQSGKELCLLSELKFAKDTVEVLDSDTKLCRLRIDNSGLLMSNSKIQLTESYTTNLYDIHHFDKEYVYFFANNLKYDSIFKCYNVNHDYGSSKHQWLPRYRLFNTSCSSLSINNGIINLPNGYGSIHECLNGKFLAVANSTFKSISIDGISFLGNAGKNGDGLIYLYKVSSESVSIDHCKFRYIKNYLLRVCGSSNVSFNNNKVDNCWYNCVISTNESLNTNVIGNEFTNNGQRMMQHCCVDCQGEDFYIADNVFKNFPYSAINVGYYFQYKKVRPSRGVVENNIIYYSKKYMKNFTKNTLMDSGAIYVTTQNDGTIIRNNRIFNYVGLYLNRGIFCDTGVQNIIIYGNVISNIQNSNAIEIYNVSSVEQIVNSANSGNFMANNIIDGKYEFSSKPNKNNILGPNIVVYKHEKKINTIRGVTVYGEDSYVIGHVRGKRKYFIN